MPPLAKEHLYSFQIVTGGQRESGFFHNKLSRLPNNEISALIQQHPELKTDRDQSAEEESLRKK